MSDVSLQQRFAGCLIGLATGDAVGTAVEFQTPGAFEPLVDMIGGGAFDLVAGQWTDDTSMALCLAESLIECGGYNPADNAERYCRWSQDGHLGSTGFCFDVGVATRSALNRFERQQRAAGTGSPYCGSTLPRSAGNGSLMRLGPVPLLFYKHAEVAMETSGDSSRVTHAVKPAVDACRYFAGLLVGCCQGKSKDEILSPFYSPLGPDYWQREGNELAPEIAEVAGGSFKVKEPPEIVGSGYVVKTLEAVLWAFNHSTSFKEGCLKVANLGHDADTTAAIYGQIAGAFYGRDGIPAEWREKVTFSSLIQLFADELLSLSEHVKLPTLPKSADEAAPVSSIDVQSLSEKYRNLKLTGFDCLEKEVQIVVHKETKGSLGYKSVEDIDVDIAAVHGKYEALPKEAQDPKLMKDFNIIMNRTKEKLAKRLRYSTD